MWPLPMNPPSYHMYLFKLVHLRTPWSFVRPVSGLGLGIPPSYVAHTSMLGGWPSTDGPSCLVRMFTWLSLSVSLHVNGP